MLHIVYISLSVTNREREGKGGQPLLAKLFYFWGNLQTVGTSIPCGSAECLVVVSSVYTKCRHQEANVMRSRSIELRGLGV